MPDRNDIDEHAKTPDNLPTPAGHLEPETILNERYLLGRRLHQGETGALYLAVDQILVRTVAIKELVVDPAQRENTIARFKRHAWQLMRLNHPSIPVVYESFYAEHLGCFYVVMEYVVGTDLLALMRSAPRGRLNEEMVTELAIKVADALDYLHTQAPIIHQNLKPERVIVTEKGDRVMLMHWFGRWAREENAGTPILDIMSFAPEELLHGRVGPKTDVYDLGASMFLLLTRGNSDDLSSISTEMKQILLPAIEYRPEDRCSAKDLRDRLAVHLDKLQRDRTSSGPVNRWFNGAAQSVRLPCVNCRSPLVAAYKFCPACGTTQSTATQARSTAAKRDEKANDPQIYLDENVQFTVYRPNKIKPLKWYPLLAYAHLTEPRDDEDGVDPIAQVQKDAERIMRDQNLINYRQGSEDSLVAVPRKGEISFVPFISGIEFNPSRASFYWEESVHRQDFRMRAPAALDGKTARGRMSVFLGTILLAEINLTVQVSSDSQEVLTEREKPARPYRRIFPSYSHKDREIVSQLEHYAQITGDKYMRDVFELRSGQNWKKWMAETIDSADIFQLFWSTHSMRSENVRLEWEYALRLKREHFIRPTYWETPLPASPSEDLPPPELRVLHFQHVRPPAYVDEVAPAATRRSSASRELIVEDTLLPYRNGLPVEVPRFQRRATDDVARPVPQPAPPSNQSPGRADSSAYRRAAAGPLWIIVTIAAILGLLLVLLFFWRS